jgi:hypothetical protein
MSQPLRILLASPDLMITSRLASLGRECGAVIETVRSLDDPPPGLSAPYDVVLIDLQAHGDDPAVLVTRVRALIAGLAGGNAPQPEAGETTTSAGGETATSDSGEAAAGGTAGGPRLVAFGPHVHRQRLDDACAAGADEAISRGELLGSLPALVRRWSG